MHPANKLTNLRRRVSRARRFPHNTCPASRHVHSIADMLAGGHGYVAMQCDSAVAQHWAGSLYSVLESLWKARTELARMKGEKNIQRLRTKGGKR